MVPDYALPSVTKRLVAGQGLVSFHEVVSMARNVVQFQKGLSEPAFEQQYGSEEQSRWRRGFECPACGGGQYSLVTTRDLYQCTKCRRQTSPIAGTIFASTPATTAMVSCNLSPDPDQAGHLQHRTGSSPWGDADHRLEAQTQAEAGHA